MPDRMQQWTAAMRDERYPDAWRLADEALAARDPATRDDPACDYHQRWVWDGTPPDGRDVLVRCYHGLGDTIQFARFLPALARRARSVTVEAPSRLVPLLRTVPAPVTIVPFDLDAPRPREQLDVEIGELDHMLRLSPRDAATPYLSWPRAVLPAGAVALCYGAGPWDPARSIPPAMLELLAAAAPVLTLMPEPTTLPVLNPHGCPLDMDATAALVAGAALVITVDTMIAHLAGALGRPTWLLLKAEPDWRWDPRARVTPWYPTMRLYVQPCAGDWGAVLDRVVVDLSRHRATTMKERA